MAIQFTEKLMPVFERMLTWAQQFEGMSLDADIRAHDGHHSEMIDLVGLIRDVQAMGA